MKLTIAHSPDSDDAYMMAPLALGWLDPDGFEIEFIRKDIEQLNAEATEVTGWQEQAGAIAAVLVPRVSRR